MSGHRQFLLVLLLVPWCLPGAVEVHPSPAHMQIIDAVAQAIWKGESEPLKAVADETMRAAIDEATIGRVHDSLRQMLAGDGSQPDAPVEARWLSDIPRAAGAFHLVQLRCPAVGPATVLLEVTIDQDRLTGFYVTNPGDIGKSAPAEVEAADGF